MKILAFSDSHRMPSLMYRVLDLLDKKIQMVLFMGDCVEDIIDYTYFCDNKQVYYVCGNCDMSYYEPSDSLIEADGKKIFITHGHRYSVKSSHHAIAAKAKSEGADICLYGHSHSPEIFIENGIYFMNPGSISLPRGISNHPTYGIIDIENNNISGKIIEVKGDRFKEIKV